MESNATVLFSQSRSWRAFPARPPLLGVSFPQIVIFLTPWIFASWSLLHETYINYPTTNCDLEGHFPCMSYLLFWTYFSPQCLSLTNHLIYCLHLSIKMQVQEGRNFHVSLTAIIVSCTIIREGNGTPLQYSCLENPMDGGAW